MKKLSSCIFPFAWHRLVFFGVISVLLIGCQKESSNPTVAVTNKQMIQGKWEVISYTSDGLDLLTDIFSSSLTCQSGQSVPFTETYILSPFYWQFTGDSTWSSEENYVETVLDEINTESTCIAVYQTSTNTYTSNGSWRFNGNESQVELQVDGVQVSWNIVSLSFQEMVLQLNNGSNRLLTLKKK
jgi:hypothetical protein